MRTLIALLLFCNCKATESAVTRSLLFLARHQSDDGSWGKPPTGCRCRPRLPIDTPMAIPIDPEVEARFNRVVPQLTDDRAEVRERAERELRSLGSPAAPLLRKSLDHADPEVALRCREALRAIWGTDPALQTICLGVEWAPEEGSEVMTTSLALLCFLGAGYSHLSKDEVQDGGRVHAYGSVLRKAASWLQSRQGDNGSFDDRSPLAHAIATTAMTELYGMTASTVYLPPAVTAIAHLQTLKSSDATFLLWKGMALHSAHSSEIPDCTPSGCGEIRDLLSQKESRAGVSGALLLSRCGKRGMATLRARIGDFDLKGLSPLEEWLVPTAAVLSEEGPMRLQVEESIWQRLSESQLRGSGCDAGSWASSGRSWEQRLVVTLYATLAVERWYRYANVLFYLPPGK